MLMQHEGIDTAHGPPSPATHSLVVGKDPPSENVSHHSTVCEQNRWIMNEKADSRVPILQIVKPRTKISMLAQRAGLHRHSDCGTRGLPGKS